MSTRFNTLLVLFFAVLATKAAAQWQQTDGVWGGDVQSIYADNSSLFIIGPGGIYRSINSGDSWHMTQLSFDVQRINLYNDGTAFFASDGSTIYIWSESTLMWIKRGTLLGNDIPSAFGSNSKYLFAGSYRGVQRSSDAGATWQRVDSSIYPGVIVAIDMYLFATYNGIVRSSDNGAHWAHADSGLSSQGVSKLFVDGRYLYAGTSYGIAVSSDYGTTWTKMSTGLPSRSVLTLTKSDNTLIAGTQEGLYYSLDSGYSWHFNSGLGLGKVNVLLTKGWNIYAGTSNGLFCSSNSGVSWVASSRGLMPLSGCGFATIGHSIYFASLPISRSDDSGNRWMATESINLFGSPISIIGSIDSMLYTYAQGSWLYRSLDGAKTWSKVNVPYAGISAIIPVSDTIFVATTGGVFKSIDHGDSWISCNSGLPMNANISSLIEVHNNLVAVVEKTNTYFSSNYGETWKKNSNGSNDPHGMTWGAVDSTIMCFSEYGNVYRKTLSDTAWTSTYSNRWSTVTSFESIDTVALIGTDKGIFVSYDNGDHWNQDSSKIGQPRINDITIMDSMLIIATTVVSESSTIWRRPLSEILFNPYSLGIKNNNGDSIWFGNIPISADSFRVVTLFNHGNLGLTIQPVNFKSGQSDFITSDLSTEVLLMPGESFTFQAIFQPKTVGYKAASLQLKSEAKTINLKLSGNAFSMADVKKNVFARALFEVYPNPTISSTTISITPEASGYAEISIVNMLGQEVTRVYSGVLDASEHAFTWDTGKMPVLRGVYQCVVRMDGQAQTLPIVVE
jgi:photosystem II stability/assembly factor-like uncharacterized protein